MLIVLIIFKVILTFISDLVEVLLGNRANIFLKNAVDESNALPHHTSPYLTIPHHTPPDLTIPHHTAPYLTIPHHTSPYVTIPHHTSRAFFVFATC